MTEPAWLQLNSDTRTLSGNATTDDVGAKTFRLVATDSSGSAFSEVTLVVTDQLGPQLGQTILPQLSQAGRTSAPASLLLYPLEAFSIGFGPETFSATTKDTAFYATSADNSPLPSWLQFDPTTLSFSGASPPLVSPTADPQEYGVRMIASNIAGFAEAVAYFQIVIGYKILAFSEISQTVELSEGQAFESEPLRNVLTLNGEPVGDTELASVTANAPSWVELDTTQILLRGIAPQGATNQSILIEVTDVYGDTANVSVNLVIFSSQSNLFNSSLGMVNVTPGQDFRYTVESNKISNSDFLVTADVRNASSWLTYDATSRTFSGSVPDDLLPGPISITLSATLGPRTEYELLRLNVLKKPVSKPPSHTSTGLPSSTNQPHLDAVSGQSDAPGNSRRKMRILLGVFLPLLFLLCLGSLVLYCCWRRQRRRGRSQQGSDIPISRPIIDPEHERIDASDLQGEAQPEADSTPTSPPRIDLLWAPDSSRESRERLSRITTHRESTLVGSGWGDLVIRDPPAPVRSSRRLTKIGPERSGEAGVWTPFVRSSSNNNLNYSRKRTPLRPSQSRVQKPSLSTRASKTLSGLSNFGVGLPARLSGAGHGAGGPGLPVVPGARRSWRYTVDSLASDDGRRTPFDLEAFPTPPETQNQRQTEQQEQTAKPSVRLVPSSSSHSGSLLDQRQRWVRERARERYERGSRFSHAWSSRVHSRARGQASSIGSQTRAQSSSFGQDDLLGRRSTVRSWSQSSSIGAPVRPEMSTRMRSPDLHLVRHPSNLRRALSTVSSGRFDSAESKSNSSWVDDLIEEEDEDGHRRWVAVDKNSLESPSVTSPAFQEGGESEQGSWGKNSRTGGLGALRANIQGTGAALPSGERRWRLGGEQAKRPVSVDEGELQRSQGSQRGNLAFV